jgi:hypothetical protein
VLTLEATPQVIEGEAWIGIGPRDQERWSFRLTLPDRIDRRADIEWSRLLPPADVTRWLSVDRDGRHLGSDPGAAEPDED